MNTGLANPRSAPSEGESSLPDLVEEVRHLLPSQAPIRRFVHHNTLHHFENMTFEEAVLEGGKLFGCEPFPTEEFFATALAQGRILERDFDEALKADAQRVTPLDPALPYGGWSRAVFRSFRLRQLLVLPDSAEIAFRLSEGDSLRQFWPSVCSRARETFLAGQSNLEEALHQLWSEFHGRCPRKMKCPKDSSIEIEQLVHSLMVRFCGGYLDQGISYWPMPHRNGMWKAFLELYSQPSIASSPWLSGLIPKLRRFVNNEVSSREALEYGLLAMGLSTSQWKQALERRGLALRGWAGMVSQMETRPDLAPVAAPPVQLIDYLAIYVTLECHGRSYFPSQAQGDSSAEEPDLELAFEAFILAQLAGFGPSTLDTTQKLESWLNEVREFHALERRRLYLWAYERRYRLGILDGLNRHSQMGEFRAQQAPIFQAVFCMDDREESLRRHLEEIEPRVQTLGMAGFFGVRMAYRGWDESRALPLCPVVSAPEHLIIEEPLDQVSALGTRVVGQWQQGLRSSRNGVLSGGMMTSTAGFLAGFSLVGRTLAPGFFHRLTRALEHSVSEPPKTRLRLERAFGSSKNAEGLWEGFTVEEMASIVGDSLTTMGSTMFAPLFLVVGHGSSSLNNPHEAAYDCGATGGGRGGPNARAFAAMANHPEVRRLLRERGLEIPDSTWFVGGYHNTCDDSMEYFDLDLIPSKHQDSLEHMKASLKKACVMDAHERCRRFDNVPLSVSPMEAYRHVQARSVTLAQPRPEYGHSTNAVCLIGRRERTRGLFLDRRCFLISYDPTTDEDGKTLKSVLEAAGPVGAGINLEYFFSSVDCSGYGCGTKLPHNITGLLGVMDGHASDLRTGLTWQMVEIHEPMRLLVIVEASTETLDSILSQSPPVRGLVERNWIQLVAWSPDSSDLWTFRRGRWEPHVLDSMTLPVVHHSRDYYAGHRGPLPPARIQSAFGGRP